MHCLPKPLPMAHRKPHIAVIGAGAFGGWAALYLLRGGAHVTLIDSWGPGNSRASSGGDTRIIRSAYGPELHYTQLAARALTLWKQHESEWKCRFYFPAGVLWMAEADDSYERASLACLKAAGVTYQQLSADELRNRWPQINFERVVWGIYEPQGGFLLARASAQAVVERFVSEGGKYRQLAVAAENLEDRPCKSLALSDGSSLAADHYVFACGPWLGRLFPTTIAPHFCATRQEVFFFGTPLGDARFDEGRIPVWGDHSDHFMYGIPGNQGRGFKVADDTRGPEFDPTSGQRLATRGWSEQRAPLPGLPFPGYAKRALARIARLPIRKYERWKFHRRPPPGERRYLARRRRLRTRLQTRPRAGRNAGPVAAQGRSGRHVLPSGTIPHATPITPPLKIRPRILRLNLLTSAFITNWLCRRH